MDIHYRKHFSTKGAFIYSARPGEQRCTIVKIDCTHLHVHYQHVLHLLHPEPREVPWEALALATIFLGSRLCGVGYVDSEPEILVTDFCPSELVHLEVLDVGVESVLSLCLQCDLALLQEMVCRLSSFAYVLASFA